MRRWLVGLALVVLATCAQAQVLPGLQNPMLLQSSAAAGCVTSASVTLTDSSIGATTGINPFTFSAQALGTAATGRRIVVAVGHLHTASATVSSVTVAGNAATAVANAAADNGAGFVRTSLYIVTVDTGTSGDIVVTWSTAVNFGGIGVWAVYDLQSSTADNTQTSTANPGSASLTTANCGVAVASSSVWKNATAVTNTWTNLTESFDEEYTAATGTQSGAQALTTGATIAVTNTRSAAPDAAATVAASFH